MVPDGYRRKLLYMLNAQKLSHLTARINVKPQHTSSFWNVDSTIPVGIGPLTIFIIIIILMLCSSGTAIWRIYYSIIETSSNFRLEPDDNGRSQRRGDDRKMDTCSTLLRPNGQ